MLSVITPFDGQPAAPVKGTMTALYCSSKALVDSQYQLTLTLGGTDEGSAGLRRAVLRMGQALV